MFDILLSIREESESPLYLRIYKQIRERITCGSILGNTRLPSVKALQLQLNISKTPIETAYQMLSAEGFVYSKPRSGYYSVNMGSACSPGIDMPSDAGTLQSPEQPMLREYAIDFHPGSVDHDMFPIRTWKRMLNLALEDYSRSIGKSGDMMGEIGLRRALADYLRSSRGVACSPEQIVIGTGISSSMDLLAKLIDGIDHVAYEEPGFKQVRDQLLSHGYRLIPIPVDSESFQIQSLEDSKAHMVYVTPSHQFPTGRVMPYVERERLLHWANKGHAYIIEDDYDGEFRYFGKPIPSLQSIDRHGRVIYIGTFSKAFTPALRMNYMVLPQSFMSKLTKMSSGLSCPSRIEQWAMQAFIEQGHWYRHIRRMRNKYRRKHDQIIECIRAMFGDKVEITGHSAGLHIQITVRTELGANDLLMLAADKGVRVYDFRQMWMKPNDAGYPRIYLGFAGLSESDMDKGIRLLKEAWSDILI
ncbi:PLP-dependent aminotransferase family protein [Cohnella terricola]|uniref:PLP-dependent aminotransferase family protein n=1 Tax=Cohnella terricola TaxID=1289167 RepID=A0A559JEM0_9BACL|nr:PLP-dependent aminotransferase family protein [Cohnella terricola]TVX98332.1 PLP-dependent aminotransferase family protein [Cohnella terricola]